MITKKEIVAKVDTSAWLCKKNQEQTHILADEPISSDALEPEKKLFMGRENCP